MKNCGGGVIKKEDSLKSEIPLLDTLCKSLSTVTKMGWIVGHWVADTGWRLKVSWKKEVAVELSKSCTELK